MGEVCQAPFAIYQPLVYISFREYTTRHAARGVGGARRPARDDRGRGGQPARPEPRLDHWVGGELGHKKEKLEEVGNVFRLSCEGSHRYAIDKHCTRTACSRTAHQLSACQSACVPDDVNSAIIGLRCEINTCPIDLRFQMILPFKVKYRLSIHSNGIQEG